MPGRVVAHTGRVAAHAAVSQRMLPCHSAVAFAPRSRYKYRIATQSLSRTVSHAHSAVSQRVAAVSQCCIAALLHRVVTPKVAPSHDTNYCIATHPMAKLCARALPQALTRRPTVSSPLLAVSWPCLAWPCAPAARPVSRYSLLYRDSTQRENGQ